MKFGTLEDIRETKIPFKVEVFPNDPAPIIRPARAESENAGNLEWTPARFGLVPFWAKDDQVAKLGRMAYNARTETVDEKRMPVIVEQENYLAWLNATPLDAVKLLKPFPPELMTSRPEPMPPRPKREKPQPKKEFAPVPTTGDLF
jgi:putative SOS response-associated peptidase YedK